MSLCDAVNILSKGETTWLLRQTVGDTNMSGMTQISNQEAANTMGAGLTWTSRENASKDPLKGYWRDVMSSDVTSMGLLRLSECLW